MWGFRLLWSEAVNSKGLTKLMFPCFQNSTSECQLKQFINRGSRMRGCQLSFMNFKMTFLLFIPCKLCIKIVYIWKHCWLEKTILWQSKYNQIFVFVRCFILCFSKLAAQRELDTFFPSFWRVLIGLSSQSQRMILTGSIVTTWQCSLNCWNHLE